MDQTTILKLVRKELDELSLLFQGFDGMAEIPQPIKTLTISKAEHLLDALRKLEYTRSEEKVVEVEPVIRDLEPEANSSEQVEVNKKTETVEEPVVKEEAPFVASAEPTAVVTEPEVEEPEQAEPEIVVESQEESAPESVKEEIHEKEMVPEDVETKKEAPSKQILGESIKAGVKVGDVVGGGGRSSLGSRLEASAITDLKKAISLADRFRFQKDLFENNARLMNSTMDKLNEMKSMEEAMACVVSEFNWDDQLESKKDFLNLIMRRFQS